MIFLCFIVMQHYLQTCHFTMQIRRYYYCEARNAMVCGILVFIVIPEAAQDCSA